MIARLFRRKGKQSAPAVVSAAAPSGVRVISEEATTRSTFSTAPDRVPVDPESSRNRPLGSIIKSLEAAPEHTRVLYNEIELRDDLRHRMAPVEITSGGGKPDAKGTYAVLVLEDMVHSDELDQMISALDGRYARATPFIYPATQNVLSSLSRESVAIKQAARDANTLHQAGAAPGDLWGNFLHIGSYALKYEASDIHVTLLDHGRSKVEFCIDGLLVGPTDFQYPTSLLQQTVAYAFQRGHGGSQGDYSPTLPQQVAINAQIANTPLLFRWASMNQIDGQYIVMRMLKQSTTREDIPTYEQRGFLPDQCKQIELAVQLPGGVIFAGPVGGGKSATCASVMATRPETMNRMTLEDPVENVQEGVHHHSFSRALGETEENAFLIGMQQLKRMNPHAVHLAEIRDYWSALLFRDVAGSNLRGTSTVHAPSAAGIPDRLSDAELRIPRSVLGTPDFINLYAFQTLLPRTCLDCAYDGEEDAALVETTLGIESLRRLDAMKLDVKSLRIRNPYGCPTCRRGGVRELNGAKGRIVVASMFTPDDDCLRFIREENKTLELRRYVQSWNEAELSEPVTIGKTAFEVAMYHVHRGTIDPREVEYKFGSIESYCNTHKIVPASKALKLVEAETA